MSFRYDEFPEIIWSTALFTFRVWCFGRGSARVKFRARGFHVGDCRSFGVHLRSYTQAPAALEISLDKKQVNREAAIRFAEVPAEKQSVPFRKPCAIDSGLMAKLF